MELFPLAQSENLGVIPYSPLGGGLFSGKYKNDQKPESGRLIENKMYQVRYGDKCIYDVAEAFTSLSEELGIHPVSLAVAWVGAHPAVTAPIIGARNLQQLKASTDASEVTMTPDLYQRISELSYTPPPATDRNEEKTSHNYGLR